MKIIQPYVEVPRIDSRAMLKAIERAARTCYKSEDKITDTSYLETIATVLKKGHESVLEHEKVSVRFIIDRGVSHEIVRHRIAAYSQESTRYCNYGNRDGEITVIDPFFFEGRVRCYRDWFDSCDRAEIAYLHMLEDGATAQEARSVLPNSLKTEIVVTYDLREWRHFFTLRCAKDAHPQMRQVAIPLLLWFQAELWPIFKDIPYDRAFPYEHIAEIKLEVKQ